MTWFTGSCRCRTVRFDCELADSPASAGEAITFAFRLLSGDYALEVDEPVSNASRPMHFFCSRCGAALVSRERTSSGMRYVVNVDSLEDFAARNARSGKEVIRTC